MAIRIIGTIEGGARHNVIDDQIRTIGTVRSFSFDYFD